MIIISSKLIVISILSLGINGLQLGLDFTGSTLLEVAYPDAVKLKPIRDSLHSNRFEDAVIQHFGAVNEVLILVAPKEGVSNADISLKLYKMLRINKYISYYY